MKQFLTETIASFGADYVKASQNKADYSIFQLAFLLLAGSLAFATRYLENKMMDNKLMLLNVTIIVGIVFFVIPFLAEYFALSFKTAAFLTWFLSVFNDKLMILLETKANKEIKKENEK